MSTLIDRALQDLDQSTDALLTANPSDVVAICSALEKRADAITRIAFLVEDESAHDPLVLNRLGSALTRGDRATRQVLDMRQDAIEEWGRLNQLMRGMAVTPEPEINYSA